MSLWKYLTGSYPPPPSPLTGLDLASPFSGDNLSRITFGELFPGVDFDLLPISRQEAMSIPAVAATRHRIVGTLSRLPIRPHSASGELWTGPSGLLEEPDEGESHVTTMRKTLDDLLFDGAAWWAVTETYAVGQDLQVRPRSVVHVPVSDVVTPTDRPPYIVDSFIRWLTDMRRVQVRTFPGTAPADAIPWLIRFDGPHQGLNTLGGRTFRSAVALERSAQHAADNPVPSVELHQTTDADLDDDAIRAMIRDWRDARRNGGVGYTNAAIELRTHGQQPEQLMINGRNQAAVDVARLAGIPAASIDAAIPGTALTYANLADRVVDLINMGLSPYASAVTGRLSMNDCLPRGVKARFDYSELYPAPPSDAGHPTGATAPTPANELEIRP